MNLENINKEKNQVLKFIDLLAKDLRRKKKVIIPTNKLNRHILILVENCELEIAKTLSKVVALLDIKEVKSYNTHK